MLASWGLQEMLCLRLNSKGKHKAEGRWRGEEKLGKNKCKDRQKSCVQIAIFGCICHKKKKAAYVLIACCCWN